MLNAYEQRLVAFYLANAAAALHHRDREASDLAEWIADRENRMATSGAGSGDECRGEPLRQGHRAGKGTDDAATRGCPLRGQAAGADIIRSECTGWNAPSLRERVLDHRASARKARPDS